MEKQDLFAVVSVMIERHHVGGIRYETEAEHIYGIYTTLEKAEASLREFMAAHPPNPDHFYMIRKHEADAWGSSKILRVFEA